MNVPQCIRKGFVLLMVFLISGVPSSLAIALPQDGTIVGGQGTINQPTPQDLVINQNTNNLIINWQGFSIGAAESVQFVQPGVDSTALNRVIGIDPSIILGQLSGNGQVFITNASGVFFGPGSQVDVHGLVATTLGISDQDFLNRTYNFKQDPNFSLASIINEGSINASYVGLLAPSVVNRGTIVANLGSVALASGKAATLDFSGNDLINFLITEEATGTGTDAEGNPLDHNIHNTGLIRSDGGQVALTAKRAGEIIKSVVNQEGVIEARTVINREGKIILSGGDNGEVVNTGTLDVTGQGAGEKGGSIQVTGDKVGLFETAKLDASGDAGGGKILIGGDREGQGDLQKSSATYVGESVSVKADAINEGDGGEIVVYAEDTARIYGDLSARGGSVSGDGGFIETSGKKFFEIAKAPDMGASNGLGGEWLIDPFNIFVVLGAVAQNINVENPFQSTGEDSLLGVNLIRQGLLQGDVSITTAGAGDQQGDINWNAGLDIDGTGLNKLSLFANRDINFNGRRSEGSSGRRLVNQNLNDSSAALFDGIPFNDEVGTDINIFNTGIFDSAPGGGDQLNLDFTAGNAINLNADISNNGTMLFTAPTINLDAVDFVSGNNPLTFVTNNLNSPNDFVFSSIDLGNAANHIVAVFRRAGSRNGTGNFIPAGGRLPARWTDVPYRRSGHFWR